MTDPEKIRELEQRLADLDQRPDADVYQKIDALNDLAWALSDIDLKRAYALSETAYTLAANPGEGAPPNQVGLAHSLRTLGYLNHAHRPSPAGTQPTAPGAGAL